MMVEDILPLLPVFVHGYLVVFTRVAAAIAFLPGFGEQIVPMRTRLAIALPVSLAVSAVVPGMPMSAPADPVALVLQIFFNAVAGLFVGLTARIIFSALQTAGQIISQSMGLAMPIPGAAVGFEGASPMTPFLVMSGIAFIFAMDIHHLMLEAIVLSFSVVPIDGTPDFSWTASELATAVALSFRIGVQVAAPFLILAFVFNLGLALTNRFMPSIQVFFVGMPILLGCGIIGAAVLLPHAVPAGVEVLVDWLGRLSH